MYSAQHSGPETSKPIQQPPAPRGPHAPQLARKVLVLLLGSLLSPCQPTTKLLNPPPIFLSELLLQSQSLVLLSELLLQSLVLLSELFEAPLEPSGPKALSLGLCLGLVGVFVLDPTQLASSWSIATAPLALLVVDEHHVLF